MSKFAPKNFQGTQYDFLHLGEMKIDVPVSAADPQLIVPMKVRFSWHCFTEEFCSSKHLDHHRYSYEGLVRAFSPERHECSLHLPTTIGQLVKSRVFRSQDSFTYVAQLNLATRPGELVPYAVYFALEKDRSSVTPALRMTVKSAYEKNEKARSGAESPRFPYLARKVSGMTDDHPKPPTKPRPKKKKGP